MAHLTGAGSDMVTLGIPITKVEKQADGTLLVYGKATGDDLDSDGQIIDRGFLDRAMPAWFDSFANIRQMHQVSLPPAGKGMELTIAPDGYYLKSRVVEPGAVKLVEAGVYQAYSIGISSPRIIRDTGAKNGRIIDGQIIETSLVDYPANSTCKFMIVKRRADGAPEYVGAQTAGTVKGASLADETEDTKAKTAAKTEEEPDAAKAKAKEEDGADAEDGDGKDKKDPKDNLAPPFKKDKGLGAALIRKYHDALCAAYSPEAVKLVYPDVAKDGASLVFGPQAVQAIYQILLAEVTEDAGSGMCANDITRIAWVYRDLVDGIGGYIEREMAEALGLDQYNDMYWSASADLHKMFLQRNDIDSVDGAAERPLPGWSARPSTEIQAGSFRRAYITEGRARLSPGEKGQIADLVKVDAGAADSGADDAAGDAAETARASRTFYSNAAKEGVRDFMASLHDGMAVLFPELCPMDAPAANKAMGSFQVVQSPGAGKGTPESVPMDTRPTSRPVSTTLPASRPAPGEKAAGADLTKAAGVDMEALVAAVTTRVGAVYEDRIADLVKTVGTLTQQVETLGAEPDPHQAPHRGIVAHSVTGRVDKTMQADAGKAAAAKQAEDTALLERWTQSPNPAQRDYAFDRLARMGAG